MRFRRLETFVPALEALSPSNKFPNNLEPHIQLTPRSRDKVTTQPRTAPFACLTPATTFDPLVTATTNDTRTVLDRGELRPSSSRFLPAFLRVTLQLQRTSSSYKLLPRAFVSHRPAVTTRACVCQCQRQRLSAAVARFSGAL